MHARPGFLLIEYMVCIALFALCIHCACGIWNSVDRLVVHTELNVLASQCSCLQQQAWATQQPQIITFDTYQNCYICNGIPYSLASQVTFGCMPAIKGPPGSPREQVTKPITFVGNRMTYHKNGIMQAGTVYLTNEKHTCQYALSNAVGSVSYIRKYVYKNGWQHIP